MLIRTSSAVALLMLMAGCNAALLQNPGAQTANGLVAMRSPHSQAETLNRLDAEVRQRNLNVVARIDHATAAQRVGQTLRPTEVMVFGNPQSGTPLMQCSQSVGIDLPLKALVWTDPAGQVWLGYNDPVWLVQRHSAADCPAAHTVRKALASLAEATVRP